MSRPRPAPTRLALAALAAVLAPAAMACTPPDPNINEDRPMVLFSDGSFQGAASDDYDYGFQGGPARDLSGGRVGQVLTTSITCYSEQWLLFADCTAGQAIVVLGLPPGPAEVEASPFLVHSTRALQPPQGPLSLTARSTVAEVAGLAARDGLTAVADVAAWSVGMGHDARFDPLFGCRVLYPGSVGAGP